MQWQDEIMKKFLSVFLAFSCMLTMVACSPDSNNLGGTPPSDSGSGTGSEVITTFEPKLCDDGIYTVSQSSGSYSAGLALPSDNMMVFADGYDQVAGQISGWVRDSDYKQIDVFIPIGRDYNSYYVGGKYDGQSHTDIIQTDANGNKLRHPTGDTYYTLPSDGFVNFLIDYAARALAAGATDVYIEEPDGFTKYLYSDYFKSEYTKEYGTWVDPATDDNARYKADKLIGDIFTRAMDNFSRGLKERYPDTKVYICTHSSLSYQTHPISANNFDIVNSTYVDGIIAQAWTDTSVGLKVNTENGNEIKAFEVSYSEYSELYSIARETGKKYYSLSDPAADGIADLGFDFARGIYEQNVTAQLIQPEINSFQISIWPDRSFGNANSDYKRVQQEVFACMQEVGTLTAKRRSGSVGAAILMSYNSVSYGNSAAINNYVQSINIPLLEEGVPPDILLLESLSQSSLNNYKVVFLSYDFIKPEEVATNKILAEFVKGGGTLVVFDASGAKTQYTGFWGEQSSAVKSLMAEMSINYSPVYGVGNLDISPTDKAPEYFKSFDLSDCGYAEIQGGVSYLTSNGKSILNGMSYGQGNVLVVGVNCNALTKSDEGRNLVKSLARFAFTLSGEKYVATKYLITERGNYLAVKTYDTTVTLEGTYVNLFDNGMTVLKNPTIEKNSYGVYKKLNADGVARVFVANCANVVAQEVNDVLTFNTKTIFLSETAVLVSLPYVNYSQITVKDSITGQDIEFDSSFNEETRMLKLSYTQSVRNSVTVTIALDYSS